MVEDLYNKHYWLIVDDDPNIVQVMTEYLELSGVDVICCTNPQEIPHILKKYHLAGVICDFIMPKMNGWEIFELIRLNEKNLIPIIMISGLYDISDDKRFSEEKNTFFFSKPVDLEKLVKIVGRKLKSNIAINPNDYRSLEVEGTVELRNSVGNTPIYLIEFSTDVMSFEVERGAVLRGETYNITLQCDVGGECILLSFSARALAVQKMENSNIDEVMFSPDDLNVDAFNKIEKVYREKQNYINDFLRVAKGYE